MADFCNAKRLYETVVPLMAVVLRTATYLTACSADAEDLAQETMLKAIKSLDHLRPGSNTKAWLLTILRNSHIDRLRARALTETSLEQMEYEPAESAPWEPREEIDACNNPESMLNEFSDQHIIDALHRLPREIRWTLLLSDIEGLDEADAATILNVPVGTIKSRLHRGRDMLRQQLAPLVPTMRMTIGSDAQVSAPGIMAPALQIA